LLLAPFNHLQAAARLVGSAIPSNFIFMAEITKSYEARDVESKWYAAWQEAKCFAGHAAPGQETYTIVIPPPNVTGILHMGHVLNNTLQDALIRRARLEGKAACWIPGTDHAGIATQTMVEKHLKKSEGKTRHDLGRDEFLKRVWAWRQEKGDIILNQLRQLGCSCDWDRTHFTMDPGYSRSVLTAFVKLYEQGLIYRGKRMVNWCPASLTALSDEEVEMRPTKSLLYKLRYELVKPSTTKDAEGNTIPLTHLNVETTRPETIPADVALAVHPDDVRYKHLIGKKVWRPLGERVQMPVVGDAAVDPVFAAGVLKVTPAHDKVDFEIGQRHHLPIIDCINANGSMNEAAGAALAGMDRFAARKKASELLKENGSLIEEKAYENNVGYSQRAGVPIEPRLTQQWWLKYPRVEEAKAVVQSQNGQKPLIQMHPERWSKVYLNWLENIQDWCISRQLWWGHRIPVWYKKGLDRENLTPADLIDTTKIHVSLDGPSDPQNWDQESDVLDTWASSWLWPFATLGWPNESEMQKAGYGAFYPTTTLATGADIIFFWVARMIMAGLEFARPGAPVEQRIPFKHVYFNGIVRDKQGRKMSKTLGNSPDPLDLIAKYGADGVRFGLLQMAPLGQDVKFDEDRIEGGKNFCNKLWNAARFRQMSGEMSDNSSLAAILARIDASKLDDDDHALLDSLLDAMTTVKDGFDNFEFASATSRIANFFWGDFCDWYVEVAKARVQDPSAKSHVLAIQDLVIREFLLLFEPFAPFITEELWHLLGYAPHSEFMQSTRIGTSVDLQNALAANSITVDRDAVERVGKLKKFVANARYLKAERLVAQKRDVQFLVLTDDTYWAAFESNMPKILRLVGALSVTRIQSEPALPAMLTPFGTLYLDTGVKVDAAAEKTRLTKELEQITKHVAGTEARLANTAFTCKAPAAVLEGARKQLADQQTKKAELERLLKAL
jgi:valyl-tRNA synthetase